MPRRRGATPPSSSATTAGATPQVFAQDSAELFAGAGLRAILLPRLLPTPVLAFAVRHLGAAAGVMVTASHNPPNDNGYKVYLGGADDGSQIVPPADAEIAAHIQRIADAGDVARAAPLARLRDRGRVARRRVHRRRPPPSRPRPTGAEGMRWVYTAMHGVGWETLSRILEVAGYPAPEPVSRAARPRRRVPDGRVPEPRGAGRDGPRVRDRAQPRTPSSSSRTTPTPTGSPSRCPTPHADGGWRRLSGNQIGLLLGWRGGAARGARRVPPTARRSPARSSPRPGLQAVAEHYGLDFHATLTGFKWISRAPGLVFGFEEALGYLVNPETVRDKDGISAAIAMLGMVDRGPRPRREPRRPASPSSTRRSATSRATRSRSASTTCRRSAGSWRRCGSSIRRRSATSPSSAIDDLLDGVDDLPPGDVLRLWLVDGSRVIVRPSGTEPKLKLYLDVRGESADDAAARIGALDGGRAGAARRRLG